MGKSKPKKIIKSNEKEDESDWTCSKCTFAGILVHEAYIISERNAITPSDYTLFFFSINELFNFREKG